MWRLLVSLLLGLASIAVHAADKRIVLIAGKPSHGPGDHEFRAGSLILQKCLARVGEEREPQTVRHNGWTVTGWPIPNGPFRRIILRSVPDDI